MAIKPIEYSRIEYAVAGLAEAGKKPQRGKSAIPAAQEAGSAIGESTGEGRALPQNPLSLLGGTDDLVKAIVQQMTKELLKDKTLLDSLLKVLIEGLAKNDLLISNFTKDILKTLLTELISNNAEFRALLNSILRELNVLVGPLVETDVTFRQYYDEQAAYDSDGTLVKIQSIKKIFMVDALESTAEFTYAQPDFGTP